MLLPGVTGSGPKTSTLTALPGPGGRRIEMTGQRSVRRGVFSAWYFKQWCNHQRVYMLIHIHQQKRSSMPSVRAVPRWQEAAVLPSTPLQYKIRGCYRHGPRFAGPSTRQQVPRWSLACTNQIISCISPHAHGLELNLVQVLEDKGLPHFSYTHMPSKAFETPLYNFPYLYLPLCLASGAIP